MCSKHSFSQVSSKSKRVDLRLRVRDGRHSLAKMESEKQSKTCVICLDEPSAKDLATLDSCKHVYCFTCIKQWVDDSENKCPQCKKSITKIAYTDEKGKQATL